ncbi:MAG: TolC family protein [Deltaproteobacteria bacterium]|nr:TolC family protein [Deltaproteobacteria bacterium]
MVLGIAPRDARLPGGGILPERAPFIRSARGLGVLALLIWSGRGRADSPPQLELAAAVARARANNPLVAAARLRIGEARGDLIGASVLLADNPEVELAAGPRLPGRGEATTIAIELGASQRFELGGQRSHRLDKARAEVEASSATAADVERVIDLAVAETFFEALAAAERLRLAEQNEQLASQLLELAQKRLDAGEGTPLDVRASRVRGAEAKRLMLAARANQRAKTAQLAKLLALEPDGQLALAGELPTEGALPPFAEVAARVAARPDLASVDHELEAARATIGLADAEAWPDLTARVLYGRDEGADTAMAGLGVPVPLFDTNQGERARARAVVDRLGAERAALLLQLTTEVRLAWLALEQAQAAVALYDAEVLRALEETAELLQRALRAGEVGLPEVIVVQREVLEGRAGHVEARLTLAIARARLLAATHLPQVPQVPHGASSLGGAQ